MKKLTKVEAETFASKLNGKQLLDITRKVVAMSGLENIIKIDGGVELDIDSILVTCSTGQDDRVKYYETGDYTIIDRQDGCIKLESSCGYGSSITIEPNFDFFQSQIDMIDMFLNVQKGNVIFNGYHVTIKRRDNQLTKLFNKVLRETITIDYPEVCI